MFARTSRAIKAYWLLAIAENGGLKGLDDLARRQHVKHMIWRRFGAKYVGHVFNQIRSIFKKTGERSRSRQQSEVTIASRANVCAFNELIAFVVSMASSSVRLNSHDVLCRDHADIGNPEPTRRDRDAQTGPRSACGPRCR
jgi:hypothetical protein